jgi:cytochrome P450
MVMCKCLLLSESMQQRNEMKISWRRLRRAVNVGFVKESVKQYYEKQITEAVHLASDSLANPAQWDQNVRRSAGSTILSVLYGHPPITTEKSHAVDSIMDVGQRLTRAAYPGAHLVEFFHWMQYIPSR